LEVTLSPPGWSRAEHAGRLASKGPVATERCPTRLLESRQLHDPLHAGARPSRRHRR
jgi:hypothetical protein